MCKQVMATGIADKIILDAGVCDAVLAYKCDRFSVYEMSDAALKKVYNEADKWEDAPGHFTFVESFGYLFDGIWKLSKFYVAGDTMKGYIPDDNIQGATDAEADEIKSGYLRKHYKDFFEYCEDVLGESSDINIFSAAVALSKKHRMKVGAFLNKFAPTL